MNLAPAVAGLAALPVVLRDRRGSGPGALPSVVLCAGVTYLRFVQ